MSRNTRIGSLHLFLWAIGICLYIWGDLFAGPVTKERAEKMVKGWLKTDPHPFEAKSAWGEIASTQRYAVGKSEYYVVYIKRGGFVIAAGDDSIEPVIAFSWTGGYFDPNETSPIWELMANDLRNRTPEPELVRDDKFKSAKKIAAKDKWGMLEYAAEQDAVPFAAFGVSSVSDIRVSPLIQSKWYNGYQSGCAGTPALYNYYTPNHYVAGCVGVALAQLMRYHEYPDFGPGTPMFNIKVDGLQMNASLRGGDGGGGVYNWSLMPFIPGCSITSDQREAIGAICSDAGIAVKMSYTSNLSTATLLSAKSALWRTFGFDNAIWADKINTGPFSSLIELLNSNLDAGLPVVLAIDGRASHAVLSDGYGYNLATMYHHLNMGWGGLDDFWYNLPMVVTSRGTFNTVTDCVYNIAPSGTGEIISGRVTDAAGNPVAGATITAQWPSGTFSSVTNAKGIYALWLMPSNTSFTITASKPGLLYEAQYASTGESSDFQSYSGNRWGVDFSYSSVPDLKALDAIASAQSGQLQAITLKCTLNGAPVPAGEVSYIIISLRSHGELYDPAGGLIAAASLPYTILNHGAIINYRSCWYYYGQDDFTFCANNGSNSNLAQAYVNTQTPEIGDLYEQVFDSGLPSGWSIINGGSSTHTWQYISGSTPISPFFWNFMIVSSAWAGAVGMDEQLVTEHFNFAGSQYVTVGFTHEFAWSTAVTQKGDFDINVNGGGWQNIARYQDDMFSGAVYFDISELADGAGDVQFRWRFYDAFWQWYWCVDDFWIEGISFQKPAPGDLNINCCVNSQDLAELVSVWLTTEEDEGWYAAYDISQPRDGRIDFRDVAVLAKDWLKTF